MERRQESSFHHDCTIVTPPPCFNLVPYYDCCTAYICELTTKAPDEMSEVHVRKETARERRWMSFKCWMNENRIVAQMKSKARMTNVPPETRPGPGALLPGPLPLTNPDHPMPWPSADAMVWVHGLGGLVWRGGGPYSLSGAVRSDRSRGTARTWCQRGGGGGWPRGQGRAGRYRKKPMRKEISREVGHISPDGR
jgi:hypothetical protein